MFPSLFFVLLPLMGLLGVPSPTYQSSFSIDFPSLGERDYHNCPTSLEIQNLKSEEYLDVEYLDGICRNIASVVRMKVSGNFYGIAEALFNKLPRLEEFEGNYMENLTELNIGTWNLKHIDFSRNRLEKITIDFMDDLIHLNLSRNHLVDEKITMTSTRPPLNLKLRVLDLSHNQLSKLDSLFPFWNLKKLLLNDNKITFIKPGILQKYPNLITLNLSKNRITDLPTGMFVGLIRLVNLDLSHNHLREAKMNVLNAMKKLEFLDMVGNDITDIKYSEVDHHLEVLRVNDEFTYLLGKKVVVPKTTEKEVKVPVTTEKMVKIPRTTQKEMKESTAED